MAAATTAPARPRASRTKATAPHSTTAQRLIEQLQAEARATLLQDLSSKNAITVLHGLDPRTKDMWFWWESITISDARGSSVDLYRCHHLPASWVGQSLETVWHPAHWYGSIYLMDGNGAKWERQLKTMVCDDFGNLVAVKGGAA